MGVERETCGDGSSDWLWTNAGTYIKDYPGPSGNIRVSIHFSQKRNSSLITSVSIFVNNYTGQKWTKIPSFLDIPFSKIQGKQARSFFFFRYISPSRKKTG